MTTAAREVLARNSKSFALAGRLLPKESRDDAAVLYAWCRRADDAVDLGPAEGADARLRVLSSEVGAIYAGEPQADPLLCAFQKLVQRHAIPEAYPRALLRGFERDLGAVRLKTRAELFVYAYRVAGVVGLMMAHVLGTRDQKAFRNAAHLGIAMQLTNICRDVLEDWERARCYLPDDVLTEAGAPGLGAELGRPLDERHGESLARAVRTLLDLARRYYRSGDAGLKALPARAALAVRTARLVYAAIGDELERRGCDVFRGRVVVARSRKLALLARAALEELLERAVGSDFCTYIGRIRAFDRADWLVYAAWVGLMVGLLAVTASFLAFGRAGGIRFPAQAYVVLAGEIIFTIAIAIDTIGHRTVYKQEIQRAEGLVHGITIFCGIGSVILLCASYHAPGSFWVPAMVLTVLSALYSLIDEAFHWRRYVSRHSDRVEMWSHVGILVGHGTMMLAWWAWFFGGYGGVSETLARLATHG